MARATKSNEDAEGFSPIWLLIESQEEVDIMAEAMGSIIGGGPYRTASNSVYETLYRFRDKRPLEDSDLRIKEVYRA